MKIFVFGNPDIAIDSLPLKILPVLQKQFPDLNFEMKDPHEEWEISDDLLIIDTALGIKKIQVFNDLDNFKSAPRFTTHDFDALFNLKLLQKLGKLRKIKIIGLPPMISEKEAIDGIKKILLNNFNGITD